MHIQYLYTYVSPPILLGPVVIASLLDWRTGLGFFTAMPHRTFTGLSM